MSGGSLRGGGKKYKSWPSSSSLSFPSFREEKRGKRIEEGLYSFLPTLSLSLYRERRKREKRKESKIPKKKGLRQKKLKWEAVRVTLNKI